MNKKLPNYRYSNCCRTCKHALASRVLDCYALTSHKVQVHPEYVCDLWELGSKFKRVRT